MVYNWIDLFFICYFDSDGWFFGELFVWVGDSDVLVGFYW